MHSEKEEGAGAAKQPGPNAQHSAEPAYSSRETRKSLQTPFSGVTYLGILAHITLAVACVAVIAAWGGFWLTPRWHLLSIDARVIAAAALLVLAACAVLLVARLDAKAGCP